MLKLIFCLSTLFIACSSEYIEDDEAGNEERKAKYAAVSTLVDANCGRCHNGTIHPLTFNEESWYASKARNRIEDNTMPPDVALEKDTRSKLLSSF